MTLRDPETCPRCDERRSRVVDSRRKHGACGAYRMRRHECACGYRWTSYQTLIHPRRLRQIEPIHHNI